jgi:hypothetical protein
MIKISKDKMIKIINLIQERDDLLRSFNVDSKAFKPEAEKSILNKPASHEEIIDLENMIGSLPPTYKTFLEIHNGWKGFPDWYGRLHIYGCDDFKSIQAKEYSDVFRSWKGNKTDPIVQNCLIFAAGEGSACGFINGVDGKQFPKQSKKDSTIVCFGKNPKTLGSFNDFYDYLERVADLISMWTEEIHEALPIDSEEAAWKCVDEAIEHFNYPEEQGEYIDESAEEIYKIMKRINVKLFKKQNSMIKLLNKELKQDGRYSLARRDIEVLEMFEHKAGQWIKI